MHLFGGQGEFVVSNSGHIQSILNPPGNPKARFMTGSHLPDEAQEWMDAASQQAGLLVAPLAGMAADTLG
jgi:Poly(3-hydroxyalkanoate) synthetase